MNSKEDANADRKQIYCPDCGTPNISVRKTCKNCEASLPKKGPLSEKLKDITPILALIVALVAIVNNNWMTERTLHENIQPHLDIDTFSQKGEMSVHLRNFGLGPADITNIQFLKNHFYSRNIENFIDLPYNARCNISQLAENGNISHIGKGEDITLVRISRESLRHEGHNDSQIDAIMMAGIKSLDGIRVTVFYEDAFGGNQKNILKELSFNKL